MRSGVLDQSLTIPITLATGFYNSLNTTIQTVVRASRIQSNR